MSGYTKTIWKSGAAPGISADKLNKLETQYENAIADASADATSKVNTHKAKTTGVHGVGGSSVASVDYVNTQFETLLTSKIKIARKAASQFNNNTILIDADDLLIFVAANEVWAFEVGLIYSANAGRDMKVGFTSPSGSTVYATFVGENASDVIEVQSVPVASTIKLSGGSTRLVTIKGVIANGASPGNLQLRFAMNTSGTYTATIYANSYIIARRLSS